jgi:hypothetical protein
MKTSLIINFSGIYFFLEAHVSDLECDGEFREQIRMKHAQGLEILDTAGIRLMSLISFADNGSTIGKLGLGANHPQSLLTLRSIDDYFSGPNILLPGKNSDQIESG